LPVQYLNATMEGHTQKNVSRKKKMLGVERKKTKLSQGVQEAKSITRHEKKNKKDLRTQGAPRKREEKKSEQGVLTPVKRDKERGLRNKGKKNALKCRGTNEKSTQTVL